MQTTEPGSGERTFIARQPILDDRHQVVAYELLCRDVGPPAAHGVDDTARTLDAAVLSIGLDELTGGRLAFLRISREVLLSDVATLLPPEGLVLQLPADVGDDPAVMAACKSLHDRGYTLSLDGFVLGSPSGALLPLADFVKIDAAGAAPEAFAAAIEHVRGVRIRAIAAHVETHDAFEAARAAGCKLFQGYYFCQPRTFAVRVISARPSRR